MSRDLNTDLIGYEPMALPVELDIQIGQRGGLRSRGLLRPRQVLYQAKLPSDELARCRSFDLRSLG
jgi:hypothetical protein